MTNCGLRWNNHIEMACNASKRNFVTLKENFKHATIEAERGASKTLSRSALEYASSIWESSEQYLTENIDKLQCVQRVS